ncbi:tail fiber protein [Rhizobium phage RHEph08]|uniref:Putative tail fiber protein n=2 Tax=Cuernavacavirus TaxID=2731935 RepID=L7TLQ3_9CAUD|nr:tail fiber protein [Rhizobium phage RHEph08]YP_009793288.1 tail fiber protein [Rhizobium phage RHEph09]AGC35975.1 putative tail fiber protein [Rhizobium phage RHEph08]AGC36029.1 putative tail fiber protein [Rhizobium phage RHEph09]
MAYSRVTIPGDGVTTQITASFALGYINQSDVKIHVTGEVDGGGNIVYRTYSKTSDTIYQVNGTPCPIGEFYVVERVVTKTELIVDWEDQEPITDANLNLMQKQTMMVAQEAFDLGITSLRTEDGSEGPTIEKGADGQMVIWEGGNIKAGPNAQDIADAQTNAAAALASANAAAGSANSASLYAGNAAASANTAQDWATKPEDQVVSGGLYSAFHWAMKAATYLASSFANAIHNATSKTALVDADELGVADSAASYGMKKTLLSTLFEYISNKGQNDWFTGFVPSYVSTTNINIGGGSGWLGGKYHEVVGGTTGTLASFLDTGTVAINSTYFLYVIRRNSDGVCAFRASLQVLESNVNVPAGWTCHRGSRVGIITTNASAQVRFFTQDGNECYINTTTWFNTSTDIATLAGINPLIPIGIKLDVLVMIDIATSGVGQDSIAYVAPYQAANASYGSTQPRSVVCRARNGSADNLSTANDAGWVRCDALSRLYALGDTSTGTSTITFLVMGWRDYQCKRIQN